MQQSNTSLQITLWALYVICIHLLECVYAYFKTLKKIEEPDDSASNKRETCHERMDRANR